MPQIPDIDQLLKECRFEAVRSSGSGGQNVNKVSTKVILLFDPVNSRSLDETQRFTFCRELSTRISRAGIFRISSERERTQLANKNRVISKFRTLVEQAFMTETERIATRPGAGSKERRLGAKKRNARQKSERSQRWNPEDEG
jgi:ribosome-associated protein